MAYLSSTFALALSFFGLVHASTFLSQASQPAEELTPEMETNVLQEIDAVLGGSQQGEHVKRIEETLRTTYAAMPKNEAGRLHHAAVRYVLHGYFVQQHAWFVRGLAAMGEEKNSSDSSPTDILQDKVDDFIQQAFETRLGGNGLDLQGVASLVLVFENLVHNEMMSNLNATFAVMEVQNNGSSLETQTVDELLDVHFMGYVMGLNYSKVKPWQLQIVKNKVDSIFPQWKTLQEFLREVRQRTGFHKSFYSRTDVESMVAEVSDSYGRWQDKECQVLKEQMMAIEDKSIGTNGSGRVRIVDFYGSAMRDGNWQFSESMQYLEHNGALDLSDPNTPRVIIPNYINSPSNCLANSKYYSVCCINECEGLMDRIEHRFGAPYVSTSELVDFVSTLPSSSVAAERTIPASLVARLEDIASHHGGLVPLHGRLFAQWLHHAYPRECEYPHLMGSVAPKTVRDFVKHSQQKPTVTKDQMAVILDEHNSKPQMERAETDEITAWSHNEELYVGGIEATASKAKAQKRRGVLQSLRPLLYMAAAVAASYALAARLQFTQKSAVYACGYGGKEHYV